MNIPIYIINLGETKLLFMIKKILLIVVIAITTNHLSAQTKISVQGGLNLMKMKASAMGISFEFDPEASLNLGVLADFKGSEKFNLRSGLLFNGNRSSLSFDNEKTKLSANYLSVPLLGRFKLSEGLYGIAGPQLGFLMSAKSTYSDGDSEDIKSEMKSTNFSGLFGAEYQFSDKFRLGVNYTAGFSNIGKSDDDFLEGGGNVRFNGFNINLGISF